MTQHSPISHIPYPCRITAVTTQSVTIQASYDSLKNSSMNPAFTSSLVMIGRKGNQGSCLKQVKSAFKGSLCLVCCPHSEQVWEELGRWECLPRFQSQREKKRPWPQFTHNKPDFAGIKGVDMEERTNLRAGWQSGTRLMQGLKGVICSWEVAFSWKAPPIASLLLLQIMVFKCSNLGQSSLHRSKQSVPETELSGWIWMPHRWGLFSRI